MFFALLPVYSWAQLLLCSELLAETKGRQRDTRHALSLKLDENLFAKVMLSNAGKPMTVKMSFVFQDSLGYKEEAGDLLKIYFADGFAQEVIKTERKVYAGTVTFTLLQAKKRREVMAYEDARFYERLRDVEIASLSLIVGNRSREIPISKVNAAYLRKAVSCLVEE